MLQRKLILGILFSIGIIFLGYTAYGLVFGPYYFTQVKEQRYSDIKKKLKNIADAQEYYLSVTGKYADKFDTLATVLKNDSILTVRAIGVESDSVQYISRTEARKVLDLPSNLSLDEETEMIGEMLADREQRFQKGEKLTIYIVKDSLYAPISSLINFDADQLYMIPHSKNDTFEMAVSSKRTAGGGVTVNLFQVNAYNAQFLFDQKSEYYKKDEGIQLGSLEEASKDIKEIINYDTE